MITFTLKIHVYNTRGKLIRIDEFSCTGERSAADEYRQRKPAYDAKDEATEYEVV